jgi:hypothetical protein
MVELGGMVPADRGYDGKVRALMQVFRQHAHDAEELIGQGAGGPPVRRLGAGIVRIAVALAAVAALTK